VDREISNAKQWLNSAALNAKRYGRIRHHENPPIRIPQESRLRPGHPPNHNRSNQRFWPPCQVRPQSARLHYQQCRRHLGTKVVSSGDYWGQL